MSATEFHAGFDFARDLRDPVMRSRLREMGHDSEPVLPAVDATPVGELLARTNGMPGRYLLAVAHTEGWRLAWIEVPT